MNLLDTEDINNIKENNRTVFNELFELEGKYNENQTRTGEILSRKNSLSKSKFTVDELSNIAS